MVLTRAQAVKVLNRLFERQVLTEVQTPLFTDVLRQHWAFYEIQEAAKNKLKGYDDSLCNRRALFHGSKGIDTPNLSLS